MSTAKIYEKMSKGELLKELDTLQCFLETQENHDEKLKRVVHELQVHQVELEMQNRRLREAHEQLEESRNLYADLYDLAPLAYVTLDRNGIIREMNLSAAELLGKDRSRLVGSPFFLLVSSEYTQACLEHLRRCAKADDKVITELTLVANNGLNIPVLITSRPATVLGPDSRFYRTAIIDLSEQKRVQAEHEQRVREQAARVEAEDVSRRKDEFLAILSHELRTPLQSILSWSHLLRKCKLTSEDFSKGLSSIENSARMQSQLINDLLDVSRAIAGKLQLDFAPVDLKSTILLAIDKVQGAAATKRIRIEHALADVGDPILGDRFRLQQIVVNLLANAVKFTPLDGSVRVLLQRQGSDAVISVIDTGRGISKEFLPHVFKRFQQANSSITRKHGGLGLGLAIVNHLVQAHHGSIEALSRGEGYGATFVVRVPLASNLRVAKGSFSEVSTSDRSSSAKSSEASMPCLDGVRLLLVDDDASTLASLRANLESSGAEVITAASVSEALDVNEQVKSDILISDIGMTGEDGYDLIRKLRSCGYDKPAIALTAYASLEDQRKALAAGFQLHIAKPVDPVELASAVFNLTRETSRKTMAS